MSKDLLEFKAVARVAASRHYPRAAQIFTLVVFGLIIAGGLAAPHVPTKLTGTLRNTNLASLVTWSLWWPLVIIGAVFVGRVWCQVCPMELVDSLAAQIGLKKRAPRFLKSGWGAVAFYGVALLGFIRTFWAHRFPERMAWFFLFLLASAVVAGLLFEKRAFCSHLCPVGRILGLYAAGSVMEWRVRDPAVCEACRTKDCVAARKSAPGITKNAALNSADTPDDDSSVGSERSNPQYSPLSVTDNSTHGPAAGSARGAAAGCASGLYPAAIKDNRDCLLCTSCLKACPSRNLRWSLRRPMADFFAGLKLTAVDLVLLMMVSGLVIWELGEEWDPAERALSFIPAALNAHLGLTGEAANLVQALVLFVALPAVLFIIPVLASKRLVKATIMESATAFGLLVLPVAALGHAAKALIRIVSRLPYYPLAFSDPVGHETALAISAGSIQLDARLTEALERPVSWLVALIMAGAILAVMRISGRSPVLRPLGRWGRFSHRTFAVLYALILFIIVLLAQF